MGKPFTARRALSVLAGLAAAVVGFALGCGSSGSNNQGGDGGTNDATSSSSSGGSGSGSGSGSSGSSGGSSSGGVDGSFKPADATTDRAGDVGDSGSGQDGEAEAGPLDCTYDDGGLQFDASSRFQGSCAGGCPAGTLCAVEIGGVAGGGGEYCAPIPDRCRSNLTCACLAGCACGLAFGRPQTCTDGTNQDGGASIACDNGIR